MRLITDDSAVGSRRCFQCGVSTPDESLTALGDGVFCPPCFSELLKPRVPDPKSKAPSATGPSDPAGNGGQKPRAPSAAARHRCLVCEQPLSMVHSEAFLGGALCGECTARLNSELREAELQETELQEAELNETELNETELQEAQGSPVAKQPALARPGGEDPPIAERDSGPIATPGAATATCAGCERLMPGPGSYRMLDGERYCAACLPFYQRRQEAQRGPVQKNSPVPCECCGRETAPDAEKCAGFLLCLACLSGDRELALVVARERHRRTLLALRTSLSKTPS